MNHSKITHAFQILCLIGLFAVALHMQFNILNNWDNFWLLHAANKLLHGGRYYKDFIETNPPMILYLYFPPLLLAAALSIKMYTAFRIYIFLIVGINLWLCNTLFKKMNYFSGHLRFCLALILIYAFAILPSVSFGEREHLMVMLTLPYFLLAALRARQVFINKRLALLIGVLAALGFALKPYFLIPLVLVESYFIWRRKKTTAWMRTESLAVLAILIAYLLSIFIFTPEYLHDILPLVWNFYFAGYYASWLLIFSQTPIVFSMVTLLLGIFLYTQSQYRALILILSLAITGFLIAYFVQHLAWYYHLLPAFITSLLLLSILFYEQIFKVFKQKVFLFNHRGITQAFMGLMIILVLTGPALKTYELSQLPFDTFYPTHYQHVFALIQKTNPKSIYVFSNAVSLNQVFTRSLHRRDASRFAGHFFIPGLVKRLHTAKNSSEIHTINQLKQKLFDATVGDFIKNKPDLVLADTSKDAVTFHGFKIDYVKLFLEDPRFQAIWKQYQYIGQFDKMNAYQRISARRHHL